MTFHASFDHGPDADFARGERTLMSASSTKRDDARPGLPAGVEIARGKGRHGDALWFRKKSSSAVFFRAAGNMPYRKSDWSGTISFWLSLDPDKDLEPGYTDPLQITERAWNDAAIWVDFSDKNPRHLRLGAFADLKVWNPSNKDFETMSPADRPMFDAGRPPFAAGKWSHVAITFEHFNTGRDGRRRHALPRRPAQGLGSRAKPGLHLGPRQGRDHARAQLHGALRRAGDLRSALDAGEIKGLHESGTIAHPKR